MVRSIATSVASAKLKSMIESLPWKNNFNFTYFLFFGRLGHRYLITHITNNQIHDISFFKY